MQASVQLREAGLQPAQRVGRLVLGRVKPSADLAQHLGARSGGGLLDRLDAATQVLGRAPLTVLDLQQPAGDGLQTLLDLAERLLRRRPRLLLEATQAAMALAELLGHVVHPAVQGSGRLVLLVQPAQQAGHGLIDSLDGGGRAAFGGFQPGGDGVDRGAEAVPAALLHLVGVVQPAAPAAALIAFGGVRTAAQRHHAVVLVFHDHGVQPLAERHARATREVLGDLAGLGVDALNAPRRGCAHLIRLPTHTQTLLVQIRGVNAPLTPRCGGAGRFLWMAAAPALHLAARRLTRP